MGARVATNAKLEVQSTIGSASNAATIITLANPGVVTISAHGYSDGDYLIATSTDGMVELDGQIVRVANKDTNTFQMEGLDTTSYSALASGATTFKKVTAFVTLSNATNLTMPDGSPTKLDATRLISKRKEYLYGLPDAPDGTINTLYDPSVAGVAKVKTATRTNTPMAMRLTWADGKKTIWNSYVSGGSGFEASQNQVVTANIAFTPIAEIVELAT